MDDRTLLETIRTHVADLCGVEPDAVRDEGKLVGYGLDSIRAVDLVLLLEEEFDVALPEHDPELTSVETVRDLARLVDRRRRGEQG